MRDHEQIGLCETLIEDVQSTRMEPVHGTLLHIAKAIGFQTIVPSCTHDCPNSLDSSTEHLCGDYDHKTDMKSVRQKTHSTPKGNTVIKG